MRDSTTVYFGYLGLLVGCLISFFVFYASLGVDSLVVDSLGVDSLVTSVGCTFGFRFLVFLVFLDFFMTFYLI